MCDILACPYATARRNACWALSNMVVDNANVVALVFLHNELLKRAIMILANDRDDVRFA